jgi:hypothetical protein
VLSIRRRRQGGGKILWQIRQNYAWSLRDGGFFRHQPGRPLRNSEGPYRNWRFSCTHLHNRTVSLYKLVIIKPLVYGDCRGLSLFNDHHPPSKRQPSIFRAASYRSAVCPKVSVAGVGGGLDPKHPGQGHYNTNIRTSCLRAVVLKSATKEVMALCMILIFNKIKRDVSINIITVVIVFCRGAQISCAMSAGRIKSCALALNFWGSTLWMLNLIICRSSRILIWILDLLFPWYPKMCAQL